MRVDVSLNQIQDSRGRGYSRNLQASDSKGGLELQQMEGGNGFAQTSIVTLVEENPGSSLKDQQSDGKRHMSFQLLSFLGLVAMFGPVQGTMYTVAVREIQETYNASLAIIGLTLSIFLWMAAIGPIPTGPAADHFGRRPVLVVGLLCFLVGSFLCAFSFTVWELLVWRTVQGLGYAVCSVIPSTVVSDLVPREEKGRYIGVIWFYIFLGPGVGPLLGGFMTEYFGWRSNFLFLGFWSVAMLLWCPFIMKETNGLRSGRPITEIISSTKHRVVGKTRIEGGGGGGGATSRYWDNDKKKEGDEEAPQEAHHRQQKQPPSQKPPSSLPSSSAPRPSSPSSSSTSSSPSPPPTKSTSKLQALLLLGRLDVLRPVLCGSLLFGTLWGTSFIYPQMLYDVYGLSPSMVGIVMVLRSMGAVIGTTLTRRLNDSIGPTAVARVTAFTTSIFSVLMGATTGEHISAVVIVLFAFGFASASCLAAVDSRLVKDLPNEAASAVACLQFSIKIVAAIIVTLIGVILEDAGYRAAMYGLGIMCFLGSLPIILCDRSNSSKSGSGG